MKEDIRAKAVHNFQFDLSKANLEKTSNSSERELCNHAPIMPMEVSQISDSLLKASRAKPTHFERVL